jgi:hypothetical protein
MGNRAKGLGLAAVLVLIVGLVMWRSRRSLTDHDVSDPGITL